MSEHYFEFRNVSKSFGDNDVLKDVSFFIDQGETAVIMGRSGVGKSVSLKLLLGFLKPDAGKIIVAGNDVTEWTEKQFAEIRRTVTMVFQSGALFDSLTVAENVAFPLETRGEKRDQDKIDAKVAELMKELEVTDFAERIPADLSTGSHFVRRAHHHGRSADGRACWRPDRKVESQTEENRDRGDPRHAPGQKIGRSGYFPAGRPGWFLRHLGRTGQHQRCVLAKFSGAR